MTLRVNLQCQNNTIRMAECGSTGISDSIPPLMTVACHLSFGCAGAVIHPTKPIQQAFSCMALGKRTVDSHVVTDKKEETRADGTRNRVIV